MSTSPITENSDIAHAYTDGMSKTQQNTVAALSWATKLDGDLFESAKKNKKSKHSSM